MILGCLLGWILAYYIAFNPHKHPHARISTESEIGLSQKFAMNLTLKILYPPVHHTEIDVLCCSLQHICAFHTLCKAWCGGGKVESRMVLNVSNYMSSLFLGPPILSKSVLFFYSYLFIFSLMVNKHQSTKEWSLHIICKYSRQIPLE